MAVVGDEIPLEELEGQEEASASPRSAAERLLTAAVVDKKGKGVRRPHRPRRQRRLKEKNSRKDYHSVPEGEDDSEDLEAVAWRKPGRRTRKWRIRGFACASIFLGFLLILNLFYLITRQIYGDDEDPDAIFDNWGRKGSGTEGMAWYPTDFLRDVLPIPCHSHNDYWRKVPLYSALHVGCIGVEADVWLHGQELLVGHDTAALQPNRTLRSLYIQPLVEILERQNPVTEYYNKTRRGVFDTDPDQTLTLLVDVKTDGVSTWPLVVEQLEPLRERGWLSVFENGAVRRGPVTVVGTGNTPFELVIRNSSYRDTFFDAPLAQLENSSYDSTNSYWSSASLQESIGSGWLASPIAEQIAKIQKHVQEAHARGLKARYWELPFWPIHLRNQVWDLLVQQRMDILNVDNLKDAARHDWSKAWGI